MRHRLCLVGDKFKAQLLERRKRLSPLPLFLNAEGVVCYEGEVFDSLLAAHLAATRFVENSPRVLLQILVMEGSEWNLLNYL